MTKISIIVPIYNVEKYLKRSLDSLVNQTLEDIEIILVDDGSTDNSHKIAEDYKENYSNVLLVTKENGGLSDARNYALPYATGEYIAFLDSDDIWHSDFLAKQLAFMQQNDAALVFSSYRRIDENTKEEILQPFIVPKKVSYSSLLKTCPIFPSTAIYDLNRCKKYYFNEKMGSLRDDYVYWLEMLKEIKYAYGNKEILVDYRIRKSSVTANKRKVIKPQWLVLRKVEKIPLIPACYYFICWAIISFFKYLK